MYIHKKIEQVYMYLYAYKYTHVFNILYTLYMYIYTAMAGVPLPAKRDDLLEKVDGGQSNLNLGGLRHLPRQNPPTPAPQRVVWGHQEQGLVKQPVVRSVLLILVFILSGK